MPHGARILYIDDDEGLRRLAQRSLTRRGFNVSLAASGPEGVAMAAAEPFDLIAVDHYMPGQDGLQTLAELRRLPDPPPVVYVTGSEESRIAVAALKAGADDYVVKTTSDDFFDLLSSTLMHSLTQVRLRRQTEAAEEALRATNARLEALLNEVNHRVANSLQIVSAFVNMQAKTVTDAASKSALTDTQRRIEAIAQVHRSLYTSGNVDTVEMDDYLGALVTELEETWSTPGSPRRLKVSAEPIALKTDKAVSVGVIVNELVSNACKYAYPSGGDGEVRVLFARDGDTAFALRVEDDGCGLDKSAVARGTGLGTKLIAAMAASLRSEVKYDPACAGVCATLRASL